MTAPHGEQIVDDYLGRLEKQLSELHPSQRSELLSQVRGHIVEARSGLVDERDSDLLNILDRLGSPEDISAPMVRPVRRPDWLCIAAALLSCAAGLAGAIGAVMVISVAGSLEEGALSNLVGAVLAIVGGILVFRNAALAAVTLAIAAAGEGYAMSLNSGQADSVITATGWAIILVIVATSLALVTAVVSRIRRRRLSTN